MKSGTIIPKHMKNKSGVLIAAALMVSTFAFSQKAEDDDMYFTSKDRGKVANATSWSSRKKDVQADANAYASANMPDGSAVSGNGTLNQTDSYSARGENPEYSTASVTNTQSSNSGYFDPNY